MKRRRRPQTKRLVTVALLFCALAIPLLAVPGCGKQLARMEENQVKLQAMVAANARDLATISSQLHTGQGKINESIQTLDGDTRQVAAGVGTVQQQQQSLRQTVVTGNEGLNRQIGSVQENQRTLQTGVTQISDTTQRTAADLTALTQQHTALQQTVQANQAQTADRLTALAANDSQLSADVANVQTSLQTTATNLAAAHSSLKDQLAANHESLTAQVAGLSTGQQQLQTGVNALGGKADQTAADLASTRSSLQETLQVSREVLTGQMAASLQNQQALHADVRDLGGKTDKMTEDIGNVAAGQTALHQMVRANHDEVITAMAGLSDRHETLRAGLDKLDGKAERLTGDLASLATRQLSLYEAVKVNHDALATKLVDLSDSQAKLQTSLGSLSSKADALASSQDTFRQNLQGHNEATNAGVAALGMGQQALRAQVETLTATTGQTVRDVAALNERQTALHQAVQTAEKDLGEKVNQTAAGLTNVADKQATLQQSIDTGRMVLTARTTEIAQTQQALKSGIDNLGQATQRVASDLANVAAGQNDLQDAVNRQGQALSGQTARLVDVQQQIQASLNTLTTATGEASRNIATLGNNQTKLTQVVQSGMADLGTRTDKVAAGVTTVNANQNAMKDTLNRQGQVASDQMARLADDVQQMQAGLNTLTAMTGQAALDILALGNNQTGLTQATKAGMADLSTRTDKVATGQASLEEALNRQAQAVSSQVAKLADGQQQMQDNLGALTALTGQASLDILKLGNNQTDLTQAARTGMADLGTRTDKIAAGQQQMQDSLETLTATAGQTALDVIAMTTRQDAIRTALQSHEEGSGARMATLADNQQQMQGSLDAITATTAQASLDGMTLRRHQDQLGQAVQTGRQEVTAKLASLAQDQQNWLGRLEGTQAQIAAIAQSLAALDQQMAKLQTVFQTSLQNTTTALGTTSQQRQQFETKAGQDIQAVVEALAQLRQTQSSLLDQLAQVQKSTQGQADSIRSVIEHMKATPTVNSRGEEAPDVDASAGTSSQQPSPAEVKVSAAEKPQAPTAPEAAK